MSALAFEQVACDRGGRRLFEGLSFTLAPGEAALVTGPNGRGKSSLLRMAAGLLAPAAGTISRAGRVSLAAEAAALDEDRTLADALTFWARLDGHGPHEVEQALAAMRLTQIAEVPVRLLSTGQRRRATLARVIAGGAPIWLLDEPGNGLDRVALEALAAVMEGHLAGGGLILAASHQPLGLSDMREIAL